MNKEYCDENGYEIQPLDQLVPIEVVGEQMFLIWVMLKSECKFWELVLLIRMCSCSLIIPLLIIIEGDHYRYVAG